MMDCAKTTTTTQNVRLKLREVILTGAGVVRNAALLNCVLILVIFKHSNTHYLSYVKLGKCSECVFFFKIFPLL